MRQLLFLCLIGMQFLQAQRLSPNATISILTVGPGLSLNDAFGHSGFRVSDPAQGIDIVYGYGAYDFNTPNFYLKFTQGKLNYNMSQDDFKKFYGTYVYFNRSVREQILNLTQSEKESLYTSLLENYKPKNRAYLYDFFYDNCATKIRDVINVNLSNNLVFNIPNTYETSTFRTLIQNNLNTNSWGSLGIDIALGSVIDKIASPNEHMFLPKNIHLFFSEATKPSGAPLVQNSKVLYKKNTALVATSFFLSPLFVLLCLSLIIIWITYEDYKKNRRSRWLDTLLFFMTGSIGLLLILLWFATDHEATANNYNLLWAFVFNLIALRQTRKIKPKRWFCRYLRFLLILLSLLTLHWIVGVQVFAITLLPLLIALAIRYVYLIYHFK
jgi:hypothetical protein